MEMHELQANPSDTLINSSYLGQAGKTKNKRAFAGASLFVCLGLLSCAGGSRDEGADKDKDTIPIGDVSGDDSNGADNSDSDSDNNDQTSDESSDSSGADDNPGVCGDPDSHPEEDPDAYDFSLIWVANSAEGTVSKIDTRTAKELARYRTGANSMVEPSRTSVNSIGQVAVVNRTGSIVKIAPRVGLCVDHNKDGMIQTSKGPNDVLPWGEDECVIWSHELDFVAPAGSTDNQGGPRAVAWEVTDKEADPCAKDSRLWVGWRDMKSDTARVVRMTSEGEIDLEVEIDEWSCTWGHGVYGGAIDKDGDFWGTGSTGILFRISGKDGSIKRWQANLQPTGGGFFYGMTVDGVGDIWIAGWEESGLYHFNRTTEKFEFIARPPEAPPYFRGIVVDRDYQVWVANHDYDDGAGGNCGLSHYDIKTKKWVDAHIKLPNCIEPVGVSIDAENFIWVVDREAERAYKIDRDNKFSTVEVTGLKKPYTYSDMTGHALHLVEIPPDPPV